MFPLDMRYRYRICSGAMKALIDIPDAQVRSLAALCERVKQPRAVVIRQAIAEYIARHQHEAAEDAFGLWGGDAPDGLSFQEKVRAEW
jgi:predicted transcriptional regulator